MLTSALQFRLVLINLATGLVADSPVYGIYRSTVLIAISANALLICVSADLFASPHGKAVSSRR